jgi:hypothetical protein
VESKSLRITTTLKIDCRITLSCIYNYWLSPQNSNEINMPGVESNNHKSIKSSTSNRILNFNTSPNITVSE